MRYRFSSVSGAISAQFNFCSNCISDPERQQKYLSTVCRVGGLTVYDYNFFLLALPPRRQKVHSVQISNIILLKNYVLKESEQKKNTMIDGTVILSLDNQTRPIYSTLVDL